MMTITLDEIKKKYEVVIGLEVHAQLKTKSKIFCADSTEFGNDQNTQINPITLGMPGVLPVLNKEVVNMAILTGLALNCEIAEVSKFDRKQYFYPDLPKGYQISQYDMPVCKNGWLIIEDKKIGITRAHLEEDAGKLVHAGSDGIAGSTYSLVDLNRAGIPLLEIVSEPDLRNAEEAKAYMEELRNIVRYLGVCDGNLDEGSMRCDVNISLRLWEQKEFGTRAEIKNINSFRALQRAVEFEIERQAEIIENGGKIVQETRLWSESEGITKSMRSKEDANDYRYFPEPDLMTLEISREWVEEIKAKLPELPTDKRKRYVDQLGLSDYDATVIVDQMGTALFFDRIIELGVDPKTAINWLMGDITGYLKENKLNINQTKLTPENLAEMIHLINEGTISNKIAKDIIITLLEKGGSPKEIVEKQDMGVISDEETLKEIISKIISTNPESVEAYKNGKTKLFGFFVGQAMKETQGKANPQVLNDLIKQALDK
ncbi:MAG: Asp-tRNA(Asn)/Glu-tRNA(Gln) amidotransferase subunit GatB [Candidatus Gastranaerophilaceae bacterium]|jgi:aspartyl-tRNA(Asn)/glutamyl-tRNA(Gln) amidotransferase subunit B